MTEVSYRVVHHMLVVNFGSASTHICFCGKPAAEWAFQHTDPEPLYSEKGSPYSADLNAYAAMCKSCHRKLDQDSYRTNGQNNGNVHRDRLKSDAEYRAALVARSTAHMAAWQATPAAQEWLRAHGKRIAAKGNAMRRRCNECPEVANAGNMTQHQRRSGHTGWAQLEEVTPDVQ